MASHEPLFQRAATTSNRSSFYKSLIESEGAWRRPEGLALNAQSDPSASIELIAGRLNLTTKQVIEAIGSRRIVQRLKHAGWIKPLCRSRDSLYPSVQILSAQRRMQAGVMPPLLPSEKRQRARPSQIA
jgi:hypothetical protein